MSEATTDTEQQSDHVHPITEDELEEAKRGLRWAERKSRDVDREHLDSVRDQILDQAPGAAVELAPEGWDLLANALADYEIDAVGTPAPDPLHSIAFKAAVGADADLE
ncbi:hypothetical protein [Halorhabdus rudnickae]|uniref:hypothetical protein n=1 Tax=Halorhabdus rudnickae TaxID=1775544 RepID=UPI001084058C|nr:hypothetical protein [Halorhabdus rudnickae]